MSNVLSRIYDVLEFISFPYLLHSIQQIFLSPIFQNIFMKKKVQILSHSTCFSITVSLFLYSLDENELP